MMFEKKFFTEPECEVERLTVADVITTSGDDEGFEAPEVDA